MKVAEYAIYKGDEFLDLGTAQYLSEKFNIKTDTIYFMAAPSYKKRLKSRRYANALVVIRIDD